MPRSPLGGLLIRSGAVRIPTVGYLLACDPKEEADEIPHAISFTWNTGKFKRARTDFNAHSCCVFTEPEPGFIKVSGSGAYSIKTPKGATLGNIFIDSRPPRTNKRYGDIRSVTAIAGRPYAVGLQGMVYRLDGLKTWTRIDDDLPKTFDCQVADGFDASEIYAVGFRGQCRQFDGRTWTKRELPTNETLTAVKCAGDERVYVAGHDGLLLVGRGARWQVIEQEDTEEDIWDLEWFGDELYVATMRAFFRLKGQALEPVDFGKDVPKTFYHLSTAPGVMWSIGEHDVMSYDGTSWTRIV